MPKKITTAPGEALTIDTIEQLKAIADPLRQQLLHEFAKRPVTTKQVAVALGYQPTRLYHHVSKLERSGLIRLVETRPVRGATEKYYEAAAPAVRIDQKALAGSAGTEIDEAMYLGVVDGLWSNIRSDVAKVLAEDGEAEGGADEIVFLQADLDVDEETAEELRARMLDVLNEIDEAAKERPGSSGPRNKYRVTVGWHPRRDVS